MALQGADRINDELEVGFDRVFERRWHRAEIVGRCIMVLFVLAALLGLMGQGPFSHATRIDASRRLAVDFEPVSRFGTATQVTIHIRDADPGSQTVHLSGTFGEPFGLQQALPTPVAQIAAKDGFDLVFDTPPQSSDITVRLSLKPSAIGRIPLHVGTDGADLAWSQLVVP